MMEWHCCKPSGREGFDNDDEDEKEREKRRGRWVDRDSGTNIYDDDTSGFRTQSVSAYLPI